MAYSKIILNGETLMDVTSDTVAAGSLLSGKTATKNDGTKVTGNIANKTASDLTANGATVTAAAGYYSSAVSKSVAAGSAFPPAVTITKAPTIGVNTSGVVTATYTGSSSITPTVTSGYVSQGTAGTVSTTGTSTYQLTSKAAAIYYPSTADQTIASQRWLVGNQTIKSVTTSNLTAANIKSGTVVKVGDSANASRITQVTGTLKEGTPYTAKIEGNGNSSNCYIQYDGTKYYTNGQTFTFYDGDIINIYVKGANTSRIKIGGGLFAQTDSNTAATYAYTALGCNVAFGLTYNSIEPLIEVNFTNDAFDNYKTELALDFTRIENQITPTTQVQYIDPSSNYYGLGQVVVEAIPTATHANPTAAINSTTGVVTATHTQTAGYVAAGTTTGTLNLSTQAAKTVTPTTTTQTAVSAGYYTTGAVSVGPIPNTYVQPSGTSNIRTDGIYNIASYSNVSISAIRNFVGGGVSSFYSSDTELTTIGHGKFAFEGLSSVNFPNVVQILNLAFYSCSKLTSINFSKCYTVGASAFYYCTSLNTAIFSICTEVGPQAFYNCERLSNIDFPRLQRIGSQAFYGTSMTSVNFPSCSIIYNSAFQYCNSLKTIVFSSCTDIYSKAFYDCHQLFNANFPICSFIGGEAFGACYSLTSISFPSCITIGFSAFRNCSALTTVSFSVCQTISYDAFFSCSSLISISFPACTSISTSAFAQCYKLPSVFFPNCIRVGNSAFYYCSSLSTISFPACTSIGSSAFAYCSALTSAIFPNCITIGSAAFYQCDSLSIANFPECISLSYSAFYSCQNLVTVDFATCTSVGQNAFYNCRSLTTASFPVCESIGTQAFYSCYHLISFYLNNVSAVPTLGGNAFYMTPLYNYSTLAGRYGSIFVPASLFESFKTATGWAAYSSRMVSV